MAEREGFEPSRPFWSLHAFQACAFDRSAISPHASAGFDTFGVRLNEIKPLLFVFPDGRFRFAQGRRPPAISPHTVADLDAPRRAPERNKTLKKQRRGKPRLIKKWW